VLPEASSVIAAVGALVDVAGGAIDVGATTVETATDDVGVCTATGVW
jgi:hypothetical protein